MGAPPGGPVDKQPADILSTVPASDSTNVDVSTDIVIHFDEMVKRESLLTAFSLSPPPPGSVRAKWKGETLTLKFEPPLREDRTYVLTLGTDLADMRGNRLEDAFHLAFSTGDKLDRASIKGKLKNEGSSQGWNVIGYLMPDSLVENDSIRWEPDPSHDLPDATTQAGVDGSWGLQNLRSGTWRVFAFNDQDKDRLYTPWLEALAVPPFDVIASEDSSFVGRELFLVAAPPRMIPQPVRVAARVRDQLEVKFDPTPQKLDALFSLVPPPADSLVEEDWTIVDADEDIRIPSREYKPGDSTIVQLGLSAKPTGDAIFLRIQGSFGLEEIVDTVLVADLRQSSNIDSFPPTIISLKPESGAKLHRGASAVDLLFSERMSQESKGSVRLITPALDTTEAAHVWKHPNLMVVPFPETKEGGLYQLQLLGEGIQDEAGNSLRDSLLAYTYIYLPEDSLGSVSGTVDAGGSEARIHLTFRSITGFHQPMEKQLIGAKDFSFRSIPAGGWIVEGWLDQSRTETFYTGQAVPFKASDPYVISPDTVWVRARWESGDVEIIFP